VTSADSLSDDWYLIHSKSCSGFGQPRHHPDSTRTLNYAAIKYNRIVGLELLLNSAWLALSTSLVILWIRGLRFVPAGSRQPSTTVQLLALAMLIVILFPAISMTDDMQALSTAEVEHVTRRADLLPNSDQPADLAVPPDAEVFLTRSAFNLQTFARVELCIEKARPQKGSIRQSANRPPPLAV